MICHKGRYFARKKETYPDVFLYMTKKTKNQKN